MSLSPSLTICFAVAVGLLGAGGAGYLAAREDRSEVKIFVPRIDLALGEVIQREDLKSRTVGKRDLEKDVLRSEADLVGQAAIRPIEAGSLIHENDVTSSELIQGRTVVSVSIGKAFAPPDVRKGAVVDVLLSSQKVAMGKVIDRVLVVDVVHDKSESSDTLTVLLAFPKKEEEEWARLIGTAQVALALPPR